MKNALMVHKAERGSGVKKRLSELMTLYRYNVKSRTNVNYTLENIIPEVARNATITWCKSRRSKKDETAFNPRITNSATLRVRPNFSIILLMIHFNDPAFVSLLQHKKTGALSPEAPPTASAVGTPSRRGKGNKRKASRSPSADDFTDDGLYSALEGADDCQDDDDGRGGGGESAERSDGEERALALAAGGSGAGAAGADRPGAAGIAESLGGAPASGSRAGAALAASPRGLARKRVVGEEQLQMAIADAPVAVYGAPVAVQLLEGPLPLPFVKPPSQVVGVAVELPLPIEPVLQPVEEVPAQRSVAEELPVSAIAGPPASDGTMFVEVLALGGSLPLVLVGVPAPVVLTNVWELMLGELLPRSVQALPALEPVKQEPAVVRAP